MIRLGGPEGNEDLNKLFRGKKITGIDVSLNYVVIYTTVGSFCIEATTREYVSTGEIESRIDLSWEVADD